MMIEMDKPPRISDYVLHGLMGIEYFIVGVVVVLSVPIWIPLALLGKLIHLGGVPIDRNRQ